MEIAKIHELFLHSSGVNTDTRSIQKNQLFFALKGANFNGNTYALKALEEGASYAVVDEFIEENTRLILVDDVLGKLQALAKYHREQYNIPIVALTGSNGKTTTKELIHAVLSTKYKVIATIGNLNNHIGVPLTLLRLKDDTEIAIIEMGANHQKEIASYCEYTLPTHGLITNIGKAHLEGFGGEEGVLKGKTELFDFLEKNKGQVFAYTGDEKLMSKATMLHDVKYYGTPNANINLYCTASVDSSSDFLTINYKNEKIKTQLVGSYNFPNALVAIALGNYFSVDDAHIKQALEDYTPDNNRSQIKKIGANNFILDAYNANPSSMSLAIESFEKNTASQKMMILGEMKELGEYANEEHLKIVNQCRSLSIKKIVLVGKAFSNFKIENDYIHFFDTALETKEWFDAQKVEGYTILLKGSRSMGLEKIVL